MKIELFGENLVDIEFARPSELPVIAAGEDAEKCRIFIKFPSGKTVEVIATAYKQTTEVFESWSASFDPVTDIENAHSADFANKSVTENVVRISTVEY